MEIKCRLVIVNEDAKSIASFIAREQADLELIRRLVAFCDATLTGRGTEADKSLDIFPEARSRLERR